MKGTILCSVLWKSKRLKKEKKDMTCLEDLSYFYSNQMKMMNLGKSNKRNQKIKKIRSPGRPTSPSHTRIQSTSKKNYLISISPERGKNELWAIKGKRNLSKKLTIGKKGNYGTIQISKWQNTKPRIIWIQKDRVPSLFLPFKLQS